MCEEDIGTSRASAGRQSRGLIVTSRPVKCDRVCDRHSFANVNNRSFADSGVGALRLVPDSPCNASCDAVLPIRERALCSAIVFHARRRYAGNCDVSLSASFAQFWHSQIPLCGWQRCSEEIAESYRGPPCAAAVMCAATPTIKALAGSSCGPLVNARQPGFEQRFPTRDASVRFTSSVKSIRIIPRIPRLAGRARRLGRLSHLTAPSAGVGVAFSPQCV